MSQPADRAGQLLMTGTGLVQTLFRRDRRMGAARQARATSRTPLGGGTTTLPRGIRVPAIPRQSGIKSALNH